MNGSEYRLADDCLFHLTVLSCNHLTLLTANFIINVAVKLPDKSSKLSSLIEALMTTSMVKLFQVCLPIVIVTLLARKASVDTYLPT